jgi:hypothetical protein
MKKTLKQLKSDLKNAGPTWLKPDDQAIENEYKYEYLNHHTHYGFKNLDHFKDTVNKAEVLHVSPELDKNIGYRSHSQSFDDLHNLIKGYASYPQYRNEKTLKDLSDRIKDGKPVHYPMLLKWPDGKLTIMGGNTRADLSMQHHGHYDALVLDKNGK